MIPPFARFLLRQAKTKAVALVLWTAAFTLVTIGQAWFFAKLIDEAFLKSATLSSLQSIIIALVVLICLRAILAYGQEHMAGALALATKRYLRRVLVDHFFKLGPLQMDQQGALLHRSIDGLENVESYIARYVPQLIFSMMIPLFTGIAIIWYEPWLGIILLITLPLIPLFMILIGKKAKSMNEEQWQRMSLLGNHFLDVMQGITTLKVFGRAKEQVAVIARLSREFRDSTLRVLRVAFLSAFVLELISTISTALIAVYMGIALLYGHVSFFAAFFCILLAPEFYGPLRQLGAAFHTGMSGQTALEDMEAYLQQEQAYEAKGQDTLADPIKEITFTNYCFAYDKNGAQTLKDISFTLRPDEACMLVGESGAGKSTVLYALMQLVNGGTGSIAVNGVELDSLAQDWWRQQITFVPQHPSLFSGTIGENIAFGRAVSQEDIEAAAKAAGAHDFIVNLPGGYDTVLGEQGLGLSGGQKQRVALARAFVEDRPILILDEPTAHLDVETEESLAQALQRLMKGKLVLAIGHRLETMKWAQSLLVMKGGAIVERGSFDELWQAQGYFTELVGRGRQRELAVLTGDVNKYAADSCAAQSASERGVAQAATADGSATPQSDSSALLEHGSSEAETAAASKAASPIEKMRDRSKLKESYLPKDMAKYKGDEGYGMLAPSWLAMLGSMFMAFCTVFMNVGLLTTSAWLIARAAEHPDEAALGIAIVGVRFFGIGRAVCRYAERYWSHTMAFNGLYRLRVWIYSRLEPRLPAGLSQWNSGDIVARLVADIETLQFFYLRVLLPPVAAVGLTIVGVIFFAFYSVNLIYLLVGAFIANGILVPLFVFYHNRKSTKAALLARGSVKVELVECFAGLMDILSYNQVEARRKAILDKCYAMEEAQKRIHRGQNMGGAIFTFIVFASSLIAALIATDLKLNGLIAGVSIATVAIAVQAYFEALQPLTVAVHHGRESYLAYGRIMAMVEQKPAVVDREDAATELVATEVVAASATAQDGTSATTSAGIATTASATEPVATPAIEAQDLHFAYGDTPVFSDLSFTVRDGERVALVGPSGSGKSTLCRLLERFYEYQSGALKLYGQDLKSLGQEVVRDEMTSLTQESYVFHASFADNLRLAQPKASEALIDEAIHFARLDSLVASWAEGKDTIVGQGGRAMSGGQVQRLALARLYLRNRPIVLLDEPLEGLDRVTAQQIQEDLLAYTKGRTTIYITHSLQGIESFDRILFMEGGRIVESGTYEELCAKEGRFYRYCQLSMTSIQ